MSSTDQVLEKTTSQTVEQQWSGLEIAVIGMAGRFPGAASIDEFWRNLQQSVESIAALEDEHLLAHGISAETLADPNYVKAGGVIDGEDLFDAGYFGFSPREAEILDPQQRLFLETAVEALETAGYDPERYPGSIGVYGGAGMNGYLLNLYSNPDIREQVSPYELFVSNDKDFLTTRVSYKLNLKGPSVDVQTACSSSLVAVHMAAQALLSGECDMAIAGGVAISKQLGYRAQAGSIYSPDGHCRAFDAQAAGTVGGNGVGIVVLKRLEDAIADKDTIDAVIKGSAINNDGAQKVSYTAPCVSAQAAVIKAAHLMAEVPAQSISYVEAHGTGTALGDPIEIAALTQAFENSDTQNSDAQNSGTQNSDKFKQTCALGSVKTNIGHLDAAAGISGFIKTVLALKHQQIPASLHFQQPNPNIDFESGPFYVNTGLTEWKRIDVPRRAGVSSFGIGGTNAHIVLEEAPIAAENHTVAETASPQILVLSAKSPNALATASTNLASYLTRHLLEGIGTEGKDTKLKKSTFAEVAYTLQVGRSELPYRRAVVCRNLSDAVNQLQDNNSQLFNEQPSPIFLFSGQGSQHIGMAKGLYETQPAFRKSLDQCAELLSPKDIDLLSLLYSEEASQVLSQALSRTENTQPALFAIEYALAQLWMSWGIQPAALIGHSIGEYVAACLSGVFDLKTALELVATRGQLMQQMPSGSMLSVALSAEKMSSWLNKKAILDVDVAVSNGPQSCVVSGSSEEIALLQSRLEEKAIQCRLLRTSHAFHSPMMEPAAEKFVNAIAHASFNPPNIPFISNVTGTWIKPEEATSPAYWGRQLRHPVRFSEGIQTLARLTQPVFLEVGPSHTLTTLVKQHFAEGSLESQPCIVINSLPHPKSDETDVMQLHRALGELWVAGASVDWFAFQGEQRCRIPLPTYPFERSRYWVDFNHQNINQDINSASSNSSSHTHKHQQKIAIHTDMADWFYTPSWERYPLQASIKSSTQKATERPCWLVFADSESVGYENIGKQLAKTIEQSGQDVFTVYQDTDQDSSFEQSGYRTFTLNPNQSKGFEQLLSDLKLRELSPTEIVYLWSLPQNSSAQDSSAQGSSAQDSSSKTSPYPTLMQLLKACSIRSEALQITVVTEAAYDVVGNEFLKASQAEVQGLCQVVSQEYPQIGCRQIDIVRPNIASQDIDSQDIDFKSTSDKKAPQQLATVLWQELCAEVPTAVVAYRDRHRWQQTYRAVHLPDTTQAAAQAIRLRNKGLYVIVGQPEEGLTAIWQQHLIEAYQANVVVIAGTETSTLQNELQAAADKFGPVRGVFVSSPMTNEKSAAPIALLQSHHWEYNCQTKKAVLQNVVIALASKQANHTPDFCCVQSSLSSIIGGVGLAAYASANHYIDAFVTQQNQQSTFPWFGINWDAYLSDKEDEDTAETDRSETSVAQPTETSSTWGDALSEFALTPTEVWQATERVITQAMSGQIIGQIVVSKGDLLARYRKWIRATPSVTSAQDKESQPQAGGDNSYSRPQLSTAYVAPRNDVEASIVEIWQDLLKLEKVGVNDSFFDLGGHSLLAIQVISRLREAFPVEVEMRNLLFEAPTVAKIAAVISEQLPDAEEMDEMAALLAEVQSLSAEAVQAQLTGGDA